MELTWEQKRRIGDDATYHFGLIPFRRTKIFGNRWLPKPPVVQPRFDWTWRYTFHVMTPGLWVLAVLMLAGVFVGITLFFEIPLLRLSPLRFLAGLWSGISGEWALDNFVGLSDDGGSSGSAPLWLKGLITSGVLAAGHALRVILPQSAMSEEQHFREGSEEWTQAERAKASLAFGFAHLYNIIYPLASCLALSIGGRIFMAVYLHYYRKTGNRIEALHRSAALHNAYNLLACCVFGPVILWVVWTL